MSSMRHVALLIETSRAYGRGLLQGIIRYEREHGPWSIYLEPHGLEAPGPPWLRKWRGDGILARIDSLQMARAICETGVPAVDLRLTVRRMKLPSVGIDNRTVVQLALQHLTDCGFRQFAFCGLPRKQNVWMDLRCDLFQKLVEESGSVCHVFDAGNPLRSTSMNWEKTQDQIGQWLLTLPKPIGVMACNDDRGQHVLDACRRVDIRVPDDVAVIGVDNDEVLCKLAYPPLTSVDIDTQQVGYEAAALLDRMMSGAPAPRMPTLLMPKCVVPRESTDVLATDDRDLANAVRYIRQHACRGLRISDLVKVISISRRELERRFQKTLGRTPKEEILRVQIERAKELLTLTEMTAQVVSAKCGFSEPKYFSYVFHARVGTTPGAYRKMNRR